MYELRWQQRYENFSKALALLCEALAEDLDKRSDLEKEGIIQRFEYTFELGWKTLNDYLKYSGVTLEQVTPRSVIKAGFAAKLIGDGHAWMSMLENRNLIAHTYNEKTFRRAIDLVANTYKVALEDFAKILEKQL